MREGGPGQDPGWRVDRRVLGGMFSPRPSARGALEGPNALVVLRSVFVSFCAALVLIGAVVLFLTAGDSERDPPLGAAEAAGGVVLIGFAMVSLSLRIRPDLPCSDVGELVGAYRTRWFLRLAVAEGVALLGFVGVFLTGSPLPYFAGLVPAAYGYARLAPTRGNLQREDDALLSRGCPHRLYPTLLEATLGGTDEP